MSQYRLHITDITATQVNFGSGLVNLSTASNPVARVLEGVVGQWLSEGKPIGALLARVRDAVTITIADPG